MKIKLQKDSDLYYQQIEKQMGKSYPTDKSAYQEYELDCDPCTLCKFMATEALFKRGYTDVIIDVSNQKVFIHKDYKPSTIASIIKANGCIIVKLHDKQITK